MNNDFFHNLDYPSIVNTINGVFTSDSTIVSLLDFERVLDESDLYAYKNWDLGELVDGPEQKRYTVSCTFMYPAKLMPDPRGGKRLLSLGCKVRFLKTSIALPMKVEDPMDWKGGTHYPKMIKRHVWLVNIVMPRTLMNDVKEGSIDLADQTIDLKDLDEAYTEDLDKSNQETKQAQASGDGGMGGIGLPPGPGIGGLGGGPAGMPGGGL